jgi:methylase of polypeptide subunit release factors
MSDDPHLRHAELLRLGHYLLENKYHFAAVTPETQERVMARPGRSAKHARDLLGWNVPFEPRAIPQRLFELMLSAEACEQRPDGTWRATLRCSTVDHLLFFHSAFPTRERDAVFFGPDSYRFVRALLHAVERAERVVDLGCGTGVGGIVLARSREIRDHLLLADVNPRALQLAAVNAELNGARAHVRHSDMLSQVEGDIDLVIANPPYMADPEGRLYRDGGAELGCELSVRVVREVGARLAAKGGRLLLYSGAPIVEGEDQLLRVLTPVLRDTHARFSYAELDQDVFGSELERPAYRQVERIAAIWLDARFGGARS